MTWTPTWSLIVSFKMRELELKNKIINGDSLKELKKIPDETFDLVFADPPYNLQLKNKLTNFGLNVDDNHIIAIYQPPYQFIDRINEIWIEINKNDLDGLLSSNKLKVN